MINGQAARPISTAKLNALLRLHLLPINQVIYLGPYSVNRMRSLILGCTSRLYAFSAYHDPTWLPSVCSWRNNWYTRGLSIPVLSYWGQLPSNFLRPRRIGTELSHDVLNPARVPL